MIASHRFHNACRRRALAIVGVLLAGLAPQWLQAMDPRPITGATLAGDPIGTWSTAYTLSATDCTVNALAEFEGELVVAGRFDVIGEVSAHNIARWNGTRWLPIGTGVDGEIRALAVYRGELIAAGANDLQSWNGQAWRTLGAGIGNGPVGALEVYQDELVLGGSFTTIGGIVASNIASWNGQSFRPYGSGVRDPQASSVVFDLLVFPAGPSGILVVGGSFTEAGGKPAPSLAAWDGESWTPLAPGLARLITAMTVSGSSLLVGGVGDRGESWVEDVGAETRRPVGSLLDLGTSAPRAFAFHRGELYVAGFRFENQTATPLVRRFDGEAWQPAEIGLGDRKPQFSSTLDFVTALLVYQNRLLAGGLFGLGVAEYDGTAWNTLPGPGLGLDGPVAALARYGGGLAAAGSFVHADGVRTGGIALLEGGVWRSLADSVRSGAFAGRVQAMVEYQGDLFVGGEFTRIDGVPVANIARFDGEGWSPVVKPFVGEIFAFAVFGTQLVAGGAFSSPGRGAAVFDGSDWRGLGTGIPGTVRALAVQNDLLVIGGSFRGAGGLNVTRWNGTQFLSTPAVAGDVTALTIYDGSIIAGGSFLDGIGSRAIRLGVEGWEPVTSGLENDVIALASYKSTMIAGMAIADGSESTDFIRRWNGASWEPMNGGVVLDCDPFAGRVSALAVQGGGLFAGGSFSVAGGNPSYAIGEWRERPEPVTEFEAVGVGESAILRWRNPRSLDFSGVEVRVDSMAPILTRTDGRPVPNGAQGIFPGTPAAADSFVHVGLRSGQPYWYGIFAFDTLSEFSDVVADSATPLDTQPPGVATRFFAAPADTSVALSWTAPPDEDTRGVRIVYAVGEPPPQSGLIFRPIENLNDGRFPCIPAQADSFVHLGRRNGERYTYRLSAYDEADNFGPPLGAIAIPADMNAPLPLASFALERGDSELRLGWDFVLGDDVQGVLVRFDTLATPVDTLSGQPVPNGRNGNFTTDELGFTHRPLRNGTSYHYAAFTFDEAGNLSLPVTVSGSPADSIAPEPVFGFRAVAGDTTVVLTFTTPEEADLAGVRIVFSDAPFQDLSLATPFPNGSDGRFPARLLQPFTIPHTPLVNGTTYFYAAQAFDEADNRSIPVFGSATPRDSLAPAGVTSFTAAPGDTTVVLTWTTPQDVDVSSVQVVFDLQPLGQDPIGGLPVPNGADGRFGMGPREVRSFEHKPLPNGRTHYYAIRVFDEASNASFPAFVQTTPRDTLAPAALASFVAEPLDTQVRLRWQYPPTPDVQGIVIWYDTTEAPNPDTATPVENGSQGRFSGNANGVLEFTHPNRTNGVRYSYVARTFDEVPNFGPESRAEATPQDVTPPGPVVGLMAASEDSVLALTWTNPGDDDYVGTVVRYSVRAFPADPGAERPFPRSRIGRFTGAEGGTTVARGGGLVNGVTYFFSLFTYDERDNFSEPRQVSIRYVDSRVQNARVPPIQPATYALWSAPFDLRVGDPGDSIRMSTVFGPVLGPMGSSRWRGIGLEGSNFVVDPLVVAGRGYWISTLVPLPAEFEVTGGPAAAPVVSLQEGWNIVASPTSDPIPPSQLRVQFDQTSLTLAAAVDSTAPVLGANGFDWLDLSGDLDNNGDFADVSLVDAPLPSWKGLLVRAYRDCQICFYCGLDGPGFAPQKRPARRGATPDWFIDLAVTSAGHTPGGVRVGASRMARDGFDSQDRPRPPFPGAALTLRIDHRDWGRYSDLYSASIAASSSRAHRWPMLVSGARDRITISWTHADSLPDSLQAYAVLPGGVAVPLRDRTSFDVPLDGDAFAFDLVVRAGPFEGDFVEDGFSGLRPLRPNPSGRDGTTLLRYQVLSPSRPVLRIFDVRGRLVKEFANTPGRVGAWSVPWDHTGSDGRRVAAGLYIVQLRLGDIASTEKIVLLH